MPLLENALNTLEKSDLKITDRRRSILKTMYKENRYVSASEVKELLEEKYPNISPDTIYRNLNTFSEMELLEIAEFSGEKYFKANCGDEHHHHFICTECGYSIELTTCPLTIFKDEINESQITSHRFELFGLCKKCAE